MGHSTMSASIRHQHAAQSRHAEIAEKLELFRPKPAAALPGDHSESTGTPERDAVQHVCNMAESVPTGRASETTKPLQLQGFRVERATRIELAQPAWKAGTLPIELHPQVLHRSAITRSHHLSGRRDSNSRPPAPKAGALPGCATSRCRPGRPGHATRPWIPARVRASGGHR